MPYALTRPRPLGRLSFAERRRRETPDRGVSGPPDAPRPTVTGPKIREGRDVTEPRTGLQARLGYRGPVVRDLRDSLSAAGALHTVDEVTSTDRSADGVAVEVFDEKVDAAVRSFQQDRGLLVDGI